MNWLTDQAPRVARTIERIVDEVKEMAMIQAIDDELATPPEKGR